MVRNVGGFDRIIRIIIGIVLFVVALSAQVATGWKIGLFVVGAVALVTAFTGF
jgi:hypothetical protein